MINPEEKTKFDQVVYDLDTALSEVLEQQTDEIEFLKRNLDIHIRMRSECDSYLKSQKHFLEELKYYYLNNSKDLKGGLNNEEKILLRKLEQLNRSLIHLIEESNE